MQAAIIADDLTGAADTGVQLYRMRFDRWRRLPRSNFPRVLSRSIAFPERHIR